ncbi:MAG: M20 family metallopeptidase [Verrucomicrobiales bacterium]|nr:MAG: M20 family peptidase [Verrucomicrobiaceae bacterium]
MDNRADPTTLNNLLSSFIRIPSVNPDGDPGTGLENTGEGEMARAVGSFLEKIGAKVWYDEVEPDRPNVIGRFPGFEGKPQILLGPHLDTVGVGGMTVDPFGGQRSDGKIYGRGASDTKGTLAAMLWALSEIGAEKIRELDIGVTFAGFMGEETGQPGSRHFAQKYGSEYDFALVGEPTGNDLVFRHKGTLWLKITSAGQAAHGSMPDQGDSAISKMVELIRLLESDFRSDLSNIEYFDELLGYPTINIGVIAGGTRTNIVSEECTIEIDFRLTPQLGGEDALELFKKFLQNHKFNEIKIDIKLRCEPLNTPADNPFIKGLSDLSSEPKLVGAPWFCDAAVLSAEGGIPSIAAGPGHIDQAHTADEWIKEADLKAGASFYKEFIERAKA